jgi:hypothetical protein
MNVCELINLLDSSSKRMLIALGLPRDGQWAFFMRRETWLHTKYSILLWWLIYKHRIGG